MGDAKHWSVALADTLMKRYPDPDRFPYKSWSYSQGFMLWGMVMLWEYTGEMRYFDYVMRYAQEHVDADGNISGFAGDSMDDMMAGVILLWAYSHTKKERYRKACETIRQQYRTYPRTAAGAFWHGKHLPGEFWVDGVFMGQIFLTQYGNMFGDGAGCYAEAVRQLELIYGHCRKKDTGLLYHAWSEDGRAPWSDPATGCSPEVWSEGLGWYSLILVETLEVLPPEQEGRARIAAQLKELLQSLKITQDEHTGLWHQVVDKGGKEGNWQDTSGSAMFVYAIQKAIELGLAGKEEFGAVVEKGYKGILSKATVNAGGMVDIFDACDGLCVQNSYLEYVNYEKTVNAKEAVAAFLWAAAIVEKPTGAARMMEKGGDPY